MSTGFAGIGVEVLGSRKAQIHHLLHILQILVTDTLGGKAQRKPVKAGAGVDRIIDVSQGPVVRGIHFGYIDKGGTQQLTEIIQLLLDPVKFLIRLIGFQILVKFLRIHVVSGGLCNLIGLPVILLFQYMGELPVAHKTDNAGKQNGKDQNSGNQLFFQVPFHHLFSPA